MYYVTQIQKITDGTYAPAVYVFDNLDAAKKNYHYFLSANIGADALDYCMATIMDEVGNVIDRESWYRPVPETGEVEA